MSGWMEKKYVYDYEDYEDGGADAETMAEQILQDPESGDLQAIAVGCWGESYDNGVQPIIEMFVANGAHFAKLQNLYIGDMTYEECEVSWIEQGDYSQIWQALPNLRQLTIKGSNNLVLGDVSHEKLQSLTIICGGLPATVLGALANAHLPELETLMIYLGEENYGFDGGIADVEALTKRVQFPKLTTLGLVDSEIQNEVVGAVLGSPYLPQLHVLALSFGSLTDEGGQLILAHQDQLAHLQLLDLTYHYLSKGMMAKLAALPFEVRLADAQVADQDDDGSIWMTPMLTE